MSPAEPPLGRPRLLRRQSTSSSLMNMEIPFTPRAAKSFEIHQDPCYEPRQVNKPLPPTPKSIPLTPKSSPSTPKTILSKTPVAVPFIPQTGSSSPKASPLTPMTSPAPHEIPQSARNALSSTSRVRVMTPEAATVAAGVQPTTTRMTPLTSKSAPIVRGPTSSMHGTQAGNKAGSQKHSGVSPLLPPSFSLDPITYRSSTSKLPDPGPTRPRLTREAKTQAAPTTVSQRAQDPRNSPTMGSLAPNRQWQPSIDPQSKTRSQTSIVKDRTPQGAKSAEQLAEDYKTVLPTMPPALADTTSESYYDHETSSTNMSHHITDVADQSLMPQPRYSSDSSSLGESERPRSRFSSSSNSVSSYNGFRNPFKTVARKAFHLRTESADSNGTEWAAFTQFPEKASMPSRRRSRAGSLVGRRRSSVQQGISSLQNTLASLAVFSARSTLADTKSPAKSNGARLRNPAIPLTAYQQKGTKAWETKPKPSRQATKSVEASRIPVPLQFTASAFKPQDLAKESKPRSMVGKIASAFQSGSVQVESAVGLRTDRVKQTRSQKRREELKRKIRVVGLGDPQVDGTTGNWL